MADVKSVWIWEAIGMLPLQWDEKAFLELCKMLADKHGLIPNYSEPNETRQTYIPVLIEFIVPVRMQGRPILHAMRNSGRVEWYEFDEMWVGEVQ
jgi:hypothetical protein